MDSKIIALFSVVLVACTPQNTSWRDFTNNHRGNTQLKMDSALCQQVSQNTPSQTSSGYCKYCASINAATDVINKQNAFNNCMTARGWEQVTVTPAATPPAATSSQSSPNKGCSFNNGEIVFPLNDVLYCRTVIKLP